MESSVLNQSALPIFSTLPLAQVEPALKQVLSENRSKLQTLLKNNSAFTWENLILPMEALDNLLNKMWSPVSHLHAVMESDELRTIYNACIPLLTEYHTELMQNEILYRAVKMISESADYKNFSPVQIKAIENELRDFKLAGVSLPPKDKERFAELSKALSKLSTQFGENLLDATQGWTLHVTDQNDLKGLPEQTIQLARQTAEQHGKAGWELTLDYPCYSMVMKYLENRELRRFMYEAYVTRASDQGPQAGRWDNTKIIEDILQNRQELAKLIGTANYAEYSLKTKMAKTPEHVLNFLHELVAQSKSFGERDIRELTEFARSLDDFQQLECWDLGFYTEKLRMAKYAVSQEELRAYFPIDKVLSGMFTVMQRLFGIKIVERTDVDIWHSQVQFFEVYDHDNKLRGYFYTDLYARKHKRDGAWMDECRMRQTLPDGDLQYPVAFLTCNFTPPVNGKTAMLTHDDVQTVFHEFGHCLHHLLTQVNFASLSGINGVPWDAVEFPSQFLEHWCWDKETLKLISSHEKSGESLPDELYDKLIAAKNFQSGMTMLRQLEFALFDFRLHLEFDSTKGGQVQKILDEVRAEVGVFPTPAFNRFQNSFSHIFAGGYAAGYYSYKWAEVLASDAFSLFVERGIFDAETGRSYLKNILEQGGVYDPMELFIKFRGREPKIDALLKECGLL
ncbi:MAG TPA: M3 family metallopeptidase [Gammaproteobacteria bacterium]|nr:M3 family metallopeptidase [Gammaproteobacteria bacterium]